MEEQVISFETAKLAKSKGCYETNIIESDGALKENIVQFYNDHGYLCTERDYNKFCCVPDDDDCSEIPAPTQSLLQRWLREVCKIEVIVKSWIEGGKLVYIYSVNNLGNPSSYMNKHNKESYESALETGLQSALKLIK